MKIAISAGLEPGGYAGGGEQFLLGLLHSLGEYDRSSNSYFVIGRSMGNDWLNPHLGPNARLVRSSLSTRSLLRSALGPLRGPASKVMRAVEGASKPVIPVCDKSYAMVAPDVVHFPIQGYARCSPPCVYNPHDLQHRHLPAFFDPQEIRRRDQVFAAGCREASVVVTESQWVKTDIADQYDVDPAKIHVVYWASPTHLYELTQESLKEVLTRFRLPAQFIFYPAQTWPHKNHVRLLEAISLLKVKGVEVHLVCTGRRNSFWPEIDRKIEQLGLSADVTFCGFVSPMHLKAIYHLSHAVIFPSLFEGGGFPVLEALAEGKPLACSRVCGLHEYAGDAAVYFDPGSVEGIADAIERVLTDSETRSQLMLRAKTQAGRFSWEKMAREYVQLYEKAAASR